MPRNSVGVYTLPASNPVASGTIIATSWANPTMSDVGNEITNSLDRNGRGGMLAPFKIFDGTVSAPGMAFLNEPSSGIYRVTGGIWSLAALGSEHLRIGAGEVVLGTGVALAGDWSGVGNVVRTENANAATIFPLVPSGTSTTSAYRAHTTGTLAGPTVFAELGVSPTAAYISSRHTGSAFVPLNLLTSDLVRMIVAVDGKVGVNITPSTFQFEVGGTINATGNITAPNLNPANISCTSLTATGAVQGATIVGTISVSDSKGEVRLIPVNSQTVAYVFVTTDHGKCVRNTTGGWTLNTGVFTPGQAVSIFNASGANQTLTQGAGVTLYLGGTATTGNRTIAQRGFATIYCSGANEFVISGSGVT